VQGVGGRVVRGGKETCHSTRMLQRLGEHCTSVRPAAAGLGTTGMVEVGQIVPLTVPRVTWWMLRYTVWWLQEAWGCTQGLRASNTATAAVRTIAVAYASAQGVPVLT
jgi:hypothetical protein